MFYLLILGFLAVLGLAVYAVRRFLRCFERAADALRDLPGRIGEVGDGLHSLSGEAGLVGVLFDGVARAGSLELYAQQYAEADQQGHEIARVARQNHGPARKAEDAPLTRADSEFLAGWRAKFGEGRVKPCELVEIAQGISGLPILRYADGKLSSRSTGKYVAHLKRTHPGVRIAGPYHTNSGTFWQILEGVV